METAPVWIKTYAGMDRNGNSRRLWLRVTPPGPQEPHEQRPPALEVEPENPGPALRTPYIELDITPAEHQRLRRLIK